jgi:hypothetical protein
VAAYDWGYLWVVVAAAVVALGVAIAYAMVRWSHRNRRLDPRREAATRALYEDIDRQRRN